MKDEVDKHIHRDSDFSFQFHVEEDSTEEPGDENNVIALSEALFCKNVDSYKNHKEHLDNKDKGTRPEVSPELDRV